MALGLSTANYRIMQSKRALPQVVAVFMALAAPAVVYGSGNCSLRNPDRQVHEVFPEATSYRSVVEEVSPEIRQKVETLLGSRLSFKDLGKHTLYIILKGTIPIGFIHARSETGQMGSVELVWAYDLDLNVTGFHIQRCREPQRDVIESEAFQRKLVGKNLQGLRSFLTDNNSGVDVNALGVRAEARNICYTVLLCAVKTRLITEYVFGKTVRKARLLGNVHRFFPETQTVVRITSPLSQEATSAVGSLTAGRPAQFVPSSLTILRAVAKDERSLGVLIFSEWSTYPSHPEVWWAVSSDSVLRDVVVVGDVGSSVRRKFALLPGKRLEDLAPARRGAGNSPEAFGAQVLALLSAHNMDR